MLLILYIQKKSKLSHDTVYKPESITDAQILRMLARSMALIETTDIHFMELSNKINEFNKDSDEFLIALNKMYTERIGHTNYEPRLNNYLFTKLRDIIKNDDLAKLTQYFLREEKNLADIIRRNYEKNLLYRQPIILLVYYLIAKKKNRLKRIWPYTPDELSPFFVDIGVSQERN